MEIASSTAVPPTDRSHCLGAQLSCSTNELSENNLWM